jgi:uncharacterized protein (DUF433 family)
MPDQLRIYGGEDPRDVPAYGLTEAARYVKLAPATLRSWVRGRSYETSSGMGFFEPLIRLPEGRASNLSFWNLVEAHVLRALRTDHGVSIKAVREALDYSERELRIERLLLDRTLSTSAGEIFLDRYGELINLSRSGQVAMRAVLADHLRRVERDEGGLPIKLFPFLRVELGGAESTILIDPTVSFGRPIICGSGISTAAIAARVDAGENVEEVAQDYGLSSKQVEEALIYERAA